MESSVLRYLTFLQMAEKDTVYLDLSNSISPFNSPSSSGLKTSCSDIYCLVFQKLHVFDMHLHPGLNFVLGNGWNTSLGPDLHQLTKCFLVPERNTLISWETTVCHMFFVCVHLGSMMKRCLA